MPPTCGTSEAAHGCSSLLLPGLSIFHDPGKGGPNQGQQTKTLKVTASSAGEGGLLFSLSLGGSSAAKTSVAVPVTRSEYVSAAVEEGKLMLHATAGDSYILSIWMPLRTGHVMVLYACRSPSARSRLSQSLASLAGIRCLSECLWSIRSTQKLYLCLVLLPGRTTCAVPQQCMKLRDRHSRQCIKVVLVYVIAVSRPDSSNVTSWATTCSTRQTTTGCTTDK